MPPDHTQHTSPQRDDTSTILTFDSFFNIGQESIALTVTLFCNAIGRNGMESVREVHVTDATCYHASNHEFVVWDLWAHVPGQNPKHVRMKTERNPSQNIRGFSSSRILPATDTVTFSSSLSRLKQPKDTMVMECTFTDLRLKHIADILGIIYRVCPEYSLTSTNCWFHAAATLGSLQTFVQEWVTKAPNDIARVIVTALSEQATSEITRQFLERWPPAPAASFIPLTSEGLWTQLPYVNTPQLPPQDTIMVKPPPPPFPSPGSSLNPLVLPVLPLDESILEDIIWQHLIQGNDPQDEQVLLAVYPAFTTSHHLFAALKSLYANPQSSDVRIRPRVVDIVRQWVMCEHFGSEMVDAVSDFIRVDVPADNRFSGNRDIEVIQAQLMTVAAQASDPIANAPLLKWDPYGSSSSTPSLSPAVSRAHSSVRHSTSLWSSFGSSLQSGSPAVHDMKAKDISDLAHALAQIEIDSRSIRALPDVVKRLVWERSTMDRPPFSELSFHIYAWVFQSVLQKKIADRIKAYRLLVNLAEECVNIRNYASANALVIALQHTFITNLHRTMKKTTAESERLKKVKVAIESDDIPKPGAAPGVIYSWNKVITHLHTFLNAAQHTRISNDGQSSMVWTGFLDFQKALVQAVEMQPLSPTFSPTQYSTLLRQQLQQAWAGRKNHKDLAEELAGGEVAQKFRAESLATGFQPVAHQTKNKPS